MEKKDIVLGAMAICFVISAGLFATSQSFDSKSIKLLINSAINFETSNYLNNLDNSEFRVLYKFLGDNIDLSYRNYFCSAALVYRSTPNPDPVWLTMLAEECFRTESNSTSIDIDEIISSSNRFRNLSEFLPNPLEQNLDNLKDVQRYQNYSKWFQWGAWLFIALGFVLFFSYLVIGRKN